MGIFKICMLPVSNLTPRSSEFQSYSIDSGARPTSLQAMDSKALYWFSSLYPIFFLHILQAASYVKEIKGNRQIG
jgi:hypothetical protein